MKIESLEKIIDSVSMYERFANEIQENIKNQVEFIAHQKRFEYGSLCVLLSDIDLLRTYYNEIDKLNETRKQILDKDN